MAQKFEDFTGRVTDAWDKCGLTGTAAEAQTIARVLCGAGNTFLEKGIVFLFCELFLIVRIILEHRYLATLKHQECGRTAYGRRL